MNFKLRKTIKTVWFSLAGFFFLWNWFTFQSRNLPEGTFESNAVVEVLENSDEITFKVRLPKNELEIIFFQGGLVDPKAYAPLCRKIAENGYTCHLIKMSLRLPQRDYHKVSRMFDFSSGKYVIGGHSQGGKMAAQTVFENPGKFKGLFLMGTSHPRDIDLSGTDIPAIKMYGTKDGLASVEEVLANKSKLPSTTEWVVIEGGNHSQFGYMGDLLMDDSAEISKEKQQTIVLGEITRFFNRIEENSRPTIPH